MVSNLPLLSCESPVFVKKKYSQKKDILSTNLSVQEGKKKVNIEKKAEVKIPSQSKVQEC